MGIDYTSVGSGRNAKMYNVTPTIVVKTVRHDGSVQEKISAYLFAKEAAFFERLNEREDRCPNIVECFLMLPDRLFFSYSMQETIARRFYERQVRELRSSGQLGRLIRVREYEDPALIARWIQQVTSALGYIEKMGFCYNDLRASNCLLDRDLNLKLANFGRATTIGRMLRGTRPPWAMPILTGPLKGTYGLCSAKTEQFAVGTLLYFMVYGHEPYEDMVLSPAELSCRFWEMEFPELYRHGVFDHLISACWHNVYPAMAFVAYDFKRKTKDIASVTE